MKKIILITVLLAIVVSIPLKAQAGKPATERVEKSDEIKNLVIVWTSGEKDVFTKMVHIYTLNAKKWNWFEEITLIVWGPSAKLLAGDPELQKMVTGLVDAGVILEACIWCSNQYEVTNDLKALKIDVKGMGVPLTAYIKDPSKEVMVF